MYRYGSGSNLAPMFEIKGTYGMKKLFLYDYILPDTKPTEKGQIYRSGDTLKVVL